MKLSVNNSLAVGRYFGSTVKHLLIKKLNSGDQLFGFVNEDGGFFVIATIARNGFKCE